MKLKLLFAITLISAFTACKKDTVIGPQGPAGANGTNGINGANGTNGKDGKDGGKHYIGELTGGGIVFHVYKNADGSEHCLIAALSDQSAQWGLNGTDVEECESKWDGKTNTDAIINAGCLNTDAAKKCALLTNGGFTDWYLPSVEEFSLLANQSYDISRVLESDENGLTSGLVLDNVYWTSTEVEGANAGASAYYGGIANYAATAGTAIKTVSFRVRAIRKI